MAVPNFRIDRSEILSRVITINSIIGFNEKKVMSFAVQFNSLKFPLKSGIRPPSPLLGSQISRITGCLHQASTVGEVVLSPSLVAGQEGLLSQTRAGETILEDTGQIALALAIGRVTKIYFSDEPAEHISEALEILSTNEDPREAVRTEPLANYVLCLAAPEMNSPVFNPIRVAPSLLAADFGELAKELQLIGLSGADMIHFDVMDGQFVPNISFGITVLESVRRCSSLPFDVHLMISHPDKNDLVEKFAAAGANIISFSAETVTDMNRPPDLRSDSEIRDIIARIAKQGVVPALVLNPRTPVKFVQPYLNQLGMVLLMTVWPGYGGQKFIEDDQISSLARVRELRAMIDQIQVPVAIEIDGGINGETAGQVRNAGANILVAGTYLFQDRGLVGTRVRGLRGEVIAP